MLTKALALELAPSNIRVNAVAPGFVVTPFTAESLADPAVVSWALERIPLKRLAMPEDVAAAVAFLASEESSYMTGAELAVDGGWSAQ
jgi:NAD(P)-dependent dehydrogenase (short-subunit alcohol dehydrogenase family)